MEFVIPTRETLEIEFKSDRAKLPDNDLVDAVVAFANTIGGTIYLGVENDGTVTGLHKAHQDYTQLAAYIANKTVPPVSGSGGNSFLRKRSRMAETEPYLCITVLLY